MFATLRRRSRQRPSGSPRGRGARRPTGFRPVLEGLEGRVVPSLTVTAVAGTPQSAVVNTAFATPLQALVEDSGTPVGGVSVTFAAPSPYGTFPGGGTSVTVQTDAGGTATAPTLTAGTAAGRYPLTASLADGTSATFDLTNLPGPPYMIGSPTFGNEYATIGTPYSAQFTVFGVEDAYGNPVGPGVSVTFTVSGNAGTFPGGAPTATVVTDAGSNAHAPPFTASGNVGDYPVTISFPGFGTPPGATVNMLHNLAHDAVINGIIGILNITVRLGSVSYGDSTITNLTSLTFNVTGGSCGMTVALPPEGPVLPGPIRINASAGSTAALTIDASGVSGGTAALVTQPGAVVADGQQVLYNANAGPFYFPVTAGVNASTAPLYPAPYGAFIIGYYDGHPPLIPPTPVPMRPSEHFVQVLYLDVLGRAGTPAEVTSWANLLDNQNWSRVAVAAGIEGSFEARDRLVKTWYATYLGRPAQNGEELGWVNLLEQEQPEEQVLSDILGGSEFFARAQALAPSGTPTERYVQALYQALLGRPGGGAEVAGWDAQVAALGTQGVALDFLFSREFRADQFEGYYNALLHRPDDPAGLAFWANSPLDMGTARLGFEASAEFYASD